MNLSHLFECGMLVCFGFSWPLNVMKAYRARTAKGTSLAFICLIITGYVAGITAKIINNQFNYVLAVYFLNLAIVFTNVIVYFRNKALDRKNGVDTVTISKKGEPMAHKYDYSQAEVIFENADVSKEEKNAVVLVGGTFDNKIPVNYLKNRFDMNFKLYNKSSDNLSIKNAAEYFRNVVIPMEPEALIIHLGENDITMYQNSSEAFDKAYLELLSTVKKANKKTRLALVSVNNPADNKFVNEMNKHIKAIADSENCQFVNLENSKLWNPEATKQSVDFAYTMGLNMRKPLLDVAKILYSFAYKEIKTDSEQMIG